jgi:hypothetical protein
MKRASIAVAGGALMLALASGVWPGREVEGQAAVGFLAKDRIAELAEAADRSIGSFVPSPAAVASFVALVDPVHVRMFLCAGRPADLVLAARLARAFDAAGSAALSAEFIGVTEDLAEPRSLIDENGVAAAPEIIIYWLGAEVARMRPGPDAAVEDDLAGLVFQARTEIAEEMILDHDFFKNVFHSDLLIDCKRCHLAR